MKRIITWSFGKSQPDIPAMQAAPIAGLVDELAAGLAAISGPSDALVAG